MVLQRVVCFGDVAVVSEVSLTDHQGIDENVCLDSIHLGDVTTYYDDDLPREK